MSFPRGCQVLPFASPSLARGSLTLALTFPSCREMVFNWQEEQEKGYVPLRC